MSRHDIVFIGTAILDSVIKGFDPNAMVVMCSAMGQEAMVVDAIRYGALDFIVKPFKPDRILQTVKKVLG